MAEDPKPAPVVDPAAAKPADPVVVDPKVSDPKATDPAKPAEPAPKVEEKPPAAKVVPEKYELKLAEDSVLGPRDVEKIAAYAKEQGLSQQEAQLVLEGEAERVAKDKTEQTDAWLVQAKADKEIGGEAFEKNTALALQVVDRYFPEFKKELNRTGFGNHPDVIRGFARIGKMMTPDQLVLPSVTGGKEKKSREEIFYGKKEAS